MGSMTMEKFCNKKKVLDVNVQLKSSLYKVRRKLVLLNKYVSVFKSESLVTKAVLKLLKGVFFI